MSVPQALAGTVYEAAVGRSDGHCECNLLLPGNCGLADADKPRSHKTGHRCMEQGEHRAPLLVVPIDPEVSDRDAIGLPVEKVMVLCRACFGRRRNRAAADREARNKAALLADENALFPSDLLGPTGPTLSEQRDAA
ncbi:hypothetical protein [Streptomyces sp. SID5910]|uniref:hypothetical protein n=1 Tax=Streptomyces sp. SID5910 TaxID=2690312 RepID=UPI001367CBA0|nr:hypothetical protein [Streptomyces sp. SID5910]MYR41246.1 hypothetical protein [Streptomyces sp. SID5910]